MNRSQKPPRPLGLTLALLGSTFVFSGIPLFVIGTLLYLNNRVYSPEAGSYMGFNIPDIDYSPLIFYGATAFFFLVMAAVAWKRRHPAMRFLFPLLTAGYGFLTLLAITSNSPTPGADSMQGFQSSITGFYLAVVVGVVLYVVWFMNRWSARAFYRGYYTTEDQKLLAETYDYNRIRAKK